jgi:polynucleotide 5'-hydroxyl-kinase GRC3/NOL9
MNMAAAVESVEQRWKEAVDAAAGKQRILVLGPTDAGKSTFIRALARRTEVELIDLDPGQKMIGPPGTAVLGRLYPERLDKMIFIGTTSASALGAIAGAGAALAAAAQGRFVVNTAGFVRGLGARLQAMTAASVAPGLIVEIGGDADGPPIVHVEGVRLIRLERSPLATRKSPADRAAIRQGAFDRALADASPLRLAGVEVHPADAAFSPMPGAFPVCALADAEDMVVGVLQSAEEGAALVHAPLPERSVQQIRLGKMWAVPDGKGGWRLLEKLVPAWKE